MSAQNDFFDVSEQQKCKKNEGMKNSNLAAVDLCAIFWFYFGFFWNGGMKQETAAHIFTYFFLF